MLTNTNTNTSTTASTAVKAASGLCLAAGVAALLAGPATAAIRPSRARADLVVAPGASIQAAIDRAPAGSTIRVAPGTFAENLLVTKSVRIVGDHTTLVPPAVPRPNACSSTSPEDRLPGVCILGDLTILGPETTPTVNSYVPDVHVEGMRITGFPGSGVFSYGAERLVVSGAELDHNGLDGAMSLMSHHTTYTGNDVHDNAVFGLTIEDSPGARATITANHVVANQGVGILVRDSDQATITANSVSRNCAGIFALATRTDEATSSVRAMANAVTANNRFCPPNADGYPAFAGIGIGLLGATDSSVTANVVTGHRADDRSDLPSAGILLLDTRAFGGTAPTGAVVSHNVVLANQPADVLSDGSTAPTVIANRCTVSVPDGWC